jgi:hypothetical protein
MASVGTLSLFFPIFLPATGAAALYFAHKALYVDWASYARDFLLGPGRTSRILLTLFILGNLKNMPFAWTIRVFHSFLYHIGFGRKPPVLPPRALFHYSITQTHTSLLETDYNMHKSNSTYFSDLDVSRSHLVTHLVGATMPRFSDNASTKIILDPAGNVVKGGFGIGLGAVFCSFKKEIAPYQGYETWSRILSWDRKWLYIVTHFVVKGKVRPTSWDGKRCGPVRERKVKTDGGKDGEAVDDVDFSKYIYATAISKYVFKLGRFTVHPAIVLHEAGMLPERPGGWRGGENGVGSEEELGEVVEDGEWDWKKVESERRKGMEFARHFAALDGTHGMFDGGEDGALGRFPVG